MKQVLLICTLIIGYCFAGSREEDSLALVEIKRANPDALKFLWDEEKSLYSWDGVTTNPLGRVFRLNFQTIKIDSIPPSIGVLEYLETCSLSFSSLSSLPQEFGNLVMLKELAINSTKLKGLPDNIGNLKKLEKISLSKNKLTSLPISFQELSSLKKIDISDNAIAGFPDLSKMTQLTDFSGSNNKFGSVPKGIGNCKELSAFAANHAGIDSLPDEFWGLSKLKYIYLSYNDIKSISPSIGQLMSLSNLILINNYIQTLPNEISQCTALKYLNLTNNSLTELPSTMSACDFTNLYLGGNFLNMSDMELATTIATNAYIGGQGTLPTYVTSDSSYLFITPGGTANDIQWIKNEVPIKNAHGDSLKVNRADLAQNTYYARITSDIVEYVVFYSSKQITPNNAKSGHNNIIEPIGHIEAKVMNNKLIALSLPQSTTVSMRIYNARGQMISAIENRVMPVGQTLVPMDAVTASGVYFVKVVSPIGVVHRRFSIQ